MIYLASLVEETKDKLEGYNFIHSKKELDNLVADNIKQNRVIIRADFAHKFFTPTGLISYIQNARRINKNIIIEHDVYDAVLTEDVMINKLRDCRNIDEMIQLAHWHNEEFFDVINYLVEQYTNGYSNMLSYSRQVSELQNVIDNQNIELENKDEQLRQETRNKLLYSSKLDTLTNRINYQFGKNINSDYLFKSTVNNYDKIIYIKEITRVQFTDTMIKYLQEILKTLYNMPTRTVVIEGYYADGKINQYPNLKPHHQLIERDVIQGDILMLGMQPKLMNDILKNASGISILIVLDRAGFSQPYIDGDNVEYLYTLSDMHDRPDWLPPNRCISYDENTLNIEYIKDFDSMDAGSKIGLYSSMNIVKEIVKLVERK